MEHSGKDEEIEDLKAADAKEIHRAVREEGQEEIDRPAASLLWSGLAAGFAITASLIAEAAIAMHVGETPWRTLVVSLGYPVGFVVVILGRMQFFTESTVTAMLPLVTRPSAHTLGRTVRLWVLVLVANLVGTALATLALANLPMIDDALRDAAVTVSSAILEHGAVAIFWTAIPAGFLIAGLAWVLPNAREQSFLVIFAVTYTVGVAGLSHSVVGSAEAFTLLWAGRTDVAGSIALIAPAVVGNLVGGAGLFALLAHGQVQAEIPEEAGHERER